MKRDLYFDVDYDNKDYHQGIQMVEELRDTLEHVVGGVVIRDSEVNIVFSGGKGFHLILNGYYDHRLIAPPEGSPYGSPFEKFTTTVNKPNKNELIEQHYTGVVELLKSCNPDLLLDWMVTYDNRRIIRLPGTVHGKTMRVCKKYTSTEGKNFIKVDGRCVGYIPDPCIP